MNINHWNEWYKQFNEDSPSPFCQWFIEQGYKGELIELGSGNGRDLRELKKHFVAKGIDQSYEDEDIKKITIQDYIKNNKSPDIVYTRFVWHAIEPDVQQMIIDWCKGLLVIEARSDKGTYTGHKRNLVNKENILSQLDKYKILYCEENTGWAKYKDEDPPVIRIIAKYESNSGNN